MAITIKTSTNGGAVEEVNLATLWVDSLKQHYANNDAILVSIKDDEGEDLVDSDFDFEEMEEGEFVSVVTDSGIPLHKAESCWRHREFVRHEVDDEDEDKDPVEVISTRLQFTSPTKFDITHYKQTLRFWGKGQMTRRDAQSGKYSGFIKAKYYYSDKDGFMEETRDDSRVKFTMETPNLFGPEEYAALTQVVERRVPAGMASIVTEFLKDEDPVPIKIKAEAFFDVELSEDTDPRSIYGPM